MIKIICGESWEISTKKCSYLLIHIVQNPLSLGIREESLIINMQLQTSEVLNM